MKYLFLLLFFFSIVSCSTEKEENRIAPVQESKTDHQNSVIEKPSTTLSSENSYCYITDIINFNDTCFLHVDFIQYVTDEEEIKKFQLRNGEFEIEENGDTNYYEVPNDYIIVNENPKMRTFELTDSTALKFHPFYGDTLIDFKNTNSTLERVTMNPYYIVTANGKVKELSEIFVP